MSNISKKLFRGNSKQAWEAIKTTARKQGYCIVSFLYFAQAMKFDLYREDQGKPNNKKEEELKTTYKNALLQADFVFIDGIALQIFDRCWQFFFQPKKRKRSKNLNWTDFLPYILKHTQDKKIGIILSSVYDPAINKWPERMEKGLTQLKKEYPHIDVLASHQSIYADRGQDFPFEEIKKNIITHKNNYDYILFLNGIGGPIQEIWTEQYRSFFEDTGIIILNNGATIDYYSWFEKRAPKRIVQMRIGETLRRIIKYPKKNFHKFASMFKIIPYRGYLLKRLFLSKKQENSLQPSSKELL